MIKYHLKGVYQSLKITKNYTLNYFKVLNRSTWI